MLRTHAMARALRRAHDKSYQMDTVGNVDRMLQQAGILYFYFILQMLQRD